MSDKETHAKGQRVSNEAKSFWASFPLFRSPYAIWVLALMTLAYIINQLNRYILGSVSNSIEQEVGFGSGNGDSFEFGMLVGPIFTIPYCIALAPTGWLADRYNKIYIVAVLLVWWSICSGLMALATEFWHLAVLRAVGAMGSAGMAAVGSGIVSDVFPQRTRGTALGIFGWGVPVGLGCTYGVANVLTDALGYRWSLFICAVPGIPLAFIALLTIRNYRDRQSEFIDVNDPTEALLVKSDNKIAQEISRRNSEADNAFVPGAQTHISAWEVISFIAKDRALVFLYIAGCLRQIGGLNWIYFRNQYFENYHGLSKSEIAGYYSWLPIVGGIGGSLFFGVIADRYVIKGRGAFARLLVLFVIHLLDFPFALGVMFLPWPYLLITAFVDEFLKGYWVPGCMAAVIHLVPEQMRVQAVAYFWFVNTFVGGNSTLLSPIFISAFESLPGVNDPEPILYALSVLWVGGIFLSGVFFGLAALSQWHAVKRNENLGDVQSPKKAGYDELNEPI